MPGVERSAVESLSMGCGGRGGAARVAGAGALEGASVRCSSGTPAGQGSNPRGDRAYAGRGWNVHAVVVDNASRQPGRPGACHRAPSGPQGGSTADGRDHRSCAGRHRAAAQNAAHVVVAGSSSDAIPCGAGRLTSDVRGAVLTWTPCVSVPLVVSIFWTTSQLAVLDTRASGSRWDGFANEPGTSVR